MGVVLLCSPPARPPPMPSRRSPTGVGPPVELVPAPLGKCVRPLSGSRHCLVAVCLCHCPHLV